MTWRRSMLRRLDRLEKDHAAVRRELNENRRQVRRLLWILLGLALAGHGANLADVLPTLVGGL